MSTQLEDQQLRAADPREPADHVSLLEKLIQQHLVAVYGLARHVHKEPPRIEWLDLSSASAFATAAGVNGKTPVQGIGVYNPNAVPVSVGWPGFRAANGLGVTVPALGYLRMPLPEVNLIDIAAPLGFGGAAQLSVVLFEYSFPPELAGGSLSGSSSGTGSSTASVVTGTSPRSVAVGAASALALAANASRKGSVWVNTGTTTISLGLGATAVVGDDIVLAPNGSWSGMVGNATWTGAVYAISSAAGGTLAVTEV